MQAEAKGRVMKCHNCDAELPQEQITITPIDNESPPYVFADGGIGMFSKHVSISPAAMLFEATCERCAAITRTAARINELQVQNGVINVPGLALSVPAKDAS